MHTGDLVLHKLTSNIGLIVESWEYPDVWVLWDDEMLSVESEELMKVVHESR